MTASTTTTTITRSAARAANVMRRMNLSLADQGSRYKRSATDGPVRPIAFALPSSRRSRVPLPESSGMAETALATSFRSHLSGSLRLDDVGAVVRLAGWVSLSFWTAATIGGRLIPYYA